ncbi:metabotropic glycine receptor isoform X2 [Halyomorpha halys]|uniref:metabotropic glycine receptor isoform X2 n=1 Tax=Halyomorpha halys TaxID=286706 RepID=UPI0006D4EE8A|nr:probable G-protein coupled receptor 158 isoform X1 [Halyomorpha halys]
MDFRWVERYVMWRLVMAVAVVAADEECRPRQSALRLEEAQLPASIVESALSGGGPDPGQVLVSDPEPLVAAALGPAGLRLAYRPPSPAHTNATASLYLASLSRNYTWTPPFWDCLLQIWVFGYISNLTGSRGTSGLYYSLDRVDLDHCDEEVALMFPSKRCDPISTKCVPLTKRGNKRGFECQCQPGYMTPQILNFSRENYDLDTVEELIKCIPNCGYETNCSEQPHLFLKTIVICVQIIAMGITVATGILIFNRRKSKAVATGMWTILETLLFGILLLYASMLPLSFKPTVQNCIIMRWIRELGFIICYGAIILKLYRILMEFRTRKAHRWIVKDKDLLKYLCGMVLIMFAYLSAWTATNLNFIKEGFSIVTISVTNSGEYFETCKPLWWDYVTQIGEIVILLFGLHLGIAARNATVQFVELRYLVGAVAMETTVSSFYYIVHATLWKTLHPNHAYLAAFVRCHFTSTFVLVLIFAPLILYQSKPVRDSRHHLTHEPSDVYKPQDGLYGEIDITEVNLSEMNPEEIRAELKRLYTQLEVLRNKSICQNNPHISKRRGGRKVAHRRFSLQKKGSREKALQQKKKALEKPQTSEVEPADQEVSRTPEDSVCSMEGPSAIYNDGPSTYSELGGFGTPGSSRKN